jgi:6-phosphogluconate dehydrogenase
VRIGMVGLGRMGGNMALRLLQNGHEVVGYARSEKPVEELKSRGGRGASSLADLVAQLDAPRVLWLMVPAGEPTTEVITELAEVLESGDVVIDGGNSRYTDSIARAADLAAKGIGFVDSGTSGGIWGLTEGYCLMIGAEQDVFERVEPIFAALAPPLGYAHVGRPGSGHFVKMVHNGIEYALLQGYAEGFELLSASEFELDLSAIAEVWRHGSVVRSWLLDLLARALQQDPGLENVAGYVEDSGEGRWTLHEAIDRAVPAPAIASSLFARFASRQDESYSAKVIAALRREFGGHAVR